MRYKPRLAFAALVLAATMTTPASAAPAPYKSDAANFIYNLLFCDDPGLFANGAGDPRSPLGIVLSPAAKSDAVRRIAEDAAEESRTRMLAYNWLRARKLAVRPKILLGVIVEVPLDGGLDTLAVFADGGIRYINHTGKMSVFEQPLPGMTGAAAALLSGSRTLVGAIGPWTHPRLPPPPAGNVRMTFLVSDGLYFGEGKYADIIRDPMGGPVLKHAADLLASIVAAAAPR